MDNLVRQSLGRFVGLLKANSLHVTKKEQDGVRLEGYDPNELFLIERTESESIFVKILVSEPIILEASHGGGGGKAQAHTKTPPQENIRYGRACYEGQVHY